MTLVPLHDHVEMMREHLREGQFADVITLGHHVLRHYPKHLETYRLLGEASLETGDLSAAADLFQRVRSADPENVVALVGLSIVHEQQKQIEEAIWHLERAFEIQPANADLRKELLRLYAEQEGTARERLKLTPGGLARLYVRQGLYSQAIQEFRALLGRDPARADIQAALAETLYRVGRKQESAEIAQELLDKLPYCLKANLLLGAMWAENAVPEAQALFTRAQSLDPENTVARALLPDHWDDAPPPMLPAIEEPVEAVSAAAPVKPEQAAGREVSWLESLIPGPEPAPRADASYPQAWKAEAPPPSAPPVQPPFEEEAEAPQAAVQPLVSAAPPVVEPTAAATAEEPSAEATLELAAPPAQTTAAAKEETVLPPPFVEQEPQTRIPAPELPPAQSVEIEAPFRLRQPSIPRVGPTIPGALEKLPSWLFAGASSGGPASTPNAVAQESDAVVAARLAAIRQSQAEKGTVPAGTPSQAKESAKETEATPGDMPEWLTRARQAVRSGQAQEDAGAPTAPEEKPAWLTQPAEDSPAAPTATPEWLRADATGQAAQASTQAEEALPAWLAAADAESRTKTPSTNAALPDWLTATKEESEPPEAPPPAATVPTWLDSVPENQVETPSPETTVPEWLQTPATNEPQAAPASASRAPGPESLTGAELDETIPDWLREIMEAKEAEPAEPPPVTPLPEPELPAARVDQPVQQPQPDLAGAAVEPAMPPPSPVLRETEAGQDVLPLEPTPEPVAPVIQEAAPNVEAVAAETGQETAGSTPVAPALSQEPSPALDAEAAPEPAGSVPMVDAGQTAPEMQPQIAAQNSTVAEARQMWARGDKTGAISLYEQALQSGPGITPEVIADFERFVQEPDAPMPARRLLGDAYSMVGRYKDALDQYRMVLGK